MPRSLGGVNRAPCSNRRRRSRGLAPQLGPEVDEGVLLHALTVVGRRLRGEGLGGPTPLAGDLRHRHRALLDGPDRLPRGPVEDVAEGLLAHLGQGLDPPALHRDVGQHRRRRQVVVPQAVMHELVVPDSLPRDRLDADQALTEEVRPGPVAAVVVVGGRARRQVHVAQLLVGAHGRPHVGLPEGPPRLVLPGLVAGLALLRHRVEDPQLLAGAGVEAAHIARVGVLFGGLGVPVDDAGADHHHAAADDGRRGDAVALPVDGPPQALAQVDEARPRRRPGRAGRSPRRWSRDGRWRCRRTPASRRPRASRRRRGRCRSSPRPPRPGGRRSTTPRRWPGRRRTGR